MSSGWVKLHRKITEWGWYSDSQTVHMFVHLLLKAQHSPTEWRGQKLNPGQFVSGRKQLSAETGISEQSVRTVLNRLKSTNELTIESTKAFSIFTLNSWHIYQCDINTQPTNQPTNQPTINQRSTTCKNVKKVIMKQIHLYRNSKSPKSYKESYSTLSAGQLQPTYSSGSNHTVKSGS